jgi:hypothetical protein
MSTIAPAPTAFIPSLGAYLAGDRRRDLRTEVSVGDWWLGDGFPPAAWRAAWAPATGELYVQRLGGVEAGGRVTVLAHFTSLSDLQERLQGWEAVCGTPGSARWLLDRLGHPDAELPASAWVGDA